MAHASIIPNRGYILAGGTGSISGTVAKGSTLGQYRVGLFARNTMQLVTSKYSDTSGNWQFAYVKDDPNFFFVVALDDSVTTPVNGDISDRVDPDPPT